MNLTFINAFLAPLGYHTQTMIEYSLVKLMSSVNQNQDMMYVKKSITIGNVTVWHVFYCMFVLCSMYSTYRKIVCMYIVNSYVHMVKYSVFTHGLLNRWTDIFILPWPALGWAFNPNNAKYTNTLNICKTFRKCLFKRAKGKSTVTF